MSQPVTGPINHVRQYYYLEAIFGSEEKNKGVLILNNELALSLFLESIYRGNSLIPPGSQFEIRAFRNGDIIEPIGSGTYQVTKQVTCSPIVTISEDGIIKRYALIEQYWEKMQKRVDEYYKSLAKTTKILVRQSA